MAFDEPSSWVAGRRPVDAAPGAELVAYGTDAGLGRALCRGVADAAAGGGRDIADRRAPARRLEAEHRRVRRQASRALDRLLAPESCTPEGARVRRELAAAERDQEFYRRADLWLADIGRALAYADPDETLARLATATRALGAEQTRKIA